jgi:acetylornithine deacetylase/succinyl-diaminopimelate desuccinylase-like protein
MTRHVPVFAAALMALFGFAQAQPTTSEPKLAFDVFKELVEINTVTATGDTARAAEAMAARLLQAGFDPKDVQVLKPAPKKGNLVARLRGTGGKKPMLLVAHLDVVEALPSDWTTDPFQLVEKDGYFYGRGTGDDKFMAAAFVTNFVRFKKEGYRPERDMILVLETDEEILDANGVGITWLLKNHRDLIDAEFALNEGAGVGLSNGKPVRIGLQTAEKVSTSYRLEATDTGGHSSLPRAENNPIYRLAEGLARLGKHQFPVKLNETTRAYFERAARTEEGDDARDMRVVAQAEPDPTAAARLSTRAGFNAQLRTTCVATMLEGGHASNALPQTARATVNCRILPGESVEAVEAELVKVLADPKIKLIQPSRKAMLSDASPLNRELMATIEKVAADFWPGAHLIPTMLAGATDGLYLRNAGIPTYGHSGLGSEVGEPSRAHGKDERVSVKSFYVGNEYLYRLVKALAGGK